jgi:hydrocephalus-inducing protein
VALANTQLVRFPKESTTTQFKKSSDFIKEMTMSLPDRLALCGKQSSIPHIIDFVDIGENSCHKETQVPVDQPLFHANPSYVIFQSYRPFETFEGLLSFRNRDKVARRLKVEVDDSPYFSLAPWKESVINGGRVAPGMEASFILKFHPDAPKDYACQVICHTDREKFVVPVNAIGGRGNLMIFS